MSNYRYDNAMAPDNVYGHSIELLGQYSPVLENDNHEELREDASVHLDFACGFGAIAPFVQELGRRYVGIDVDEIALKTLSTAGFETHRLDLAGLSLDDYATALRKILGGRRVGSITMLDGLEHLGAATNVLGAIAALAAEHGALVVLSVPNVTHRDVGYKAALGSWTTTESGLLDNTHVAFYSAEELTATLSDAGLHPIARNDVATSSSDQHFPATHPALKPGTNISRFLNTLRDQAEPNGRVQQFVWACLAGPVGIRRPSHEELAKVRSTFLTVLIRTQGRRIQELGEALLCLSGQTNQDFEVVMLAHNVDVATQIQIEQVIEEQPESLRRRIRLRTVDHGTRATLLNIGFAEARTRYVSVLDDDDLVFGHWVEAFRALEAKADGAVLRSISASQTAGRISVRGVRGIRATGSVNTPYEPEFSYVSHLSHNSSPFMSLAFPIGVFLDLGVKFDETLTTTEDWDYLLRSAQLVGVVDSRELTTIYHFWDDQQSSSTEHDAEVWRLNQLSIDRKIDSEPMMLQAGESRRIRQLVRDAGGTGVVAPVSSEERDGLLYRISTLLESDSWRLTAPLRLIGKSIGHGKPPATSDHISAGVEQLRETVREIEESRSWRWTSRLRRSH